MEIRVVLFPGDGIGPEVVREAERALEAVADRFGHSLATERFAFAGAAYEETGVGFPGPARRACADARAILLGAVGDPRHAHLPAAERPERALLELRRMLSAHANLRPVRVDRVPPSSPFRPEAVLGADLLIVRELTGGLYYGEPRGISDGEDPEGVNTLRYRASEVRRIAETALELAAGRRRRLTSVDKANVLESSELWREVVTETAAAHPEVEVEHMYVDRAAMEIIRDPRQFDVILAGNLFGDILSDEASVLAGSLGLLPSASIGGRTGLYEPVHGSAPDIAGKGVANPLAAIGSAAMMLELSFGLAEEAEAMRAAMSSVLDAGTLPPDLGGDAPTRKVGDEVVRAIAG